MLSLIQLKWQFSLRWDLIVRNFLFVVFIWEEMCFLFLDGMILIHLCFTYLIRLLFHLFIRLIWILFIDKFFLLSLLTLKLCVRAQICWRCVLNSFVRIDIREPNIERNIFLWLLLRDSIHLNHLIRILVIESIWGEFLALELEGFVIANTIPKVTLDLMLQLYEYLVSTQTLRRVFESF